MGLFKNIFKKKPGGTFVGNMLRGIGDKFTGGLVSAAFPAPPRVAPAAPSVPASATPPISQILAPIQAAALGASAQKEETPKKGYMQWLREKWAYAVGGLVVVGGLIYYLTRGRKKGGSYKGRA